ncbi:hypothetical protein QFC19_003929 [Naganishia cerealis]|uniref:Uncharacterized protein n=1 Tax=Naganishia cerealis TaxID=610337 RepID=A0ACC2W008_9TREE|nr:hypothetical protein QFC19_003929 [Naganishia cerealis]
MASQRPTLQSLMSASAYETDESGDDPPSRFVDPQKLTTVRHRMQDEHDSASQARSADDPAQGKDPQNKGPKRGARACTNCRKGKNRCEGDGPACRRCLQHGLQCVFAKPTAKTQTLFLPGTTDSEGRINYIENHVSSLAATQNQMQQTLSQILSALSGNAVAQGPAIPPPPSYLPVGPPHTSSNNSNNNPISSGYPLSAPPMTSGGGGQSSYGFPPTGHHHQQPEVDMYAAAGNGTHHHPHHPHHSSGALAPPSLADRLDAFSPGTVAVLNEVAHHGLAGAGDGSNGAGAGGNGVRRSGTHHQSSISSASGHPLHHHHHQQQQHQPHQSPMGAASLSSVSTNTGPSHPQSHPQQHLVQGTILALDFAKPDVGVAYPGNMLGGSGAHVPTPSLHPLSGTTTTTTTTGGGGGPARSESSPSTMNDGLGTTGGNGVSHVRTSSFGWPDVSSRAGVAMDFTSAAGGGGGGSVGGGNYLIRRREDSPGNDSQDEESYAGPGGSTIGTGSATRGATNSGRASSQRPPRKYPKLPGFKPPPHRYAQYGLVVPSTAASSEEDESEDTLPRSSLNAPIEALQALANAADQAAAQESAAAAQAAAVAGGRSTGGGGVGGGGGGGGGGEGGRRGGIEVDVQVGGSSVDPSDISAAVGDGFLSPPRVLQKQLRFKKRQKAEPTPRNAFPDVITKGLVSESECRELWDIFFSGCHLFIPLWDRSYDVFESFVVRTPFSFDGMMAVASKIRTGNGPLDQTYHRALEEAQGIARSTLFGPVVRKEAVMAVLILAAWSQNGWLPSGHALRMGLDMHLHKALEKLNDNKSLAGQTRSVSEERDLVVSARIWMNCYLNDHMLSLGTGRPLMLKDDESVRGARILLNHPMESETDVRLIACVELMNHKVRVWETLHPLRGRIDSAAIDFVRRVNKDLLLWHEDWRGIHVEKFGQTHVLLDMLDAELYYAQLWCACVALRGCHWEKLSLDQRELAFQAKDAALKCLATYKSPPLRAYIKYAVHETMVQCSFAAVFLLKIAILFPAELPASEISLQVAELAHLLSECSAERYALTLRLMLRSFRRKMGENTMAPGTPRNGPANPMPFGGNGLAPMTSLYPAGMQSLLSNGMGEGDNGDAGFMNAAELSAWMDDLGPFNWPEDGFSPSNLPAWIMDSNVTDLGLPFEGSDSIFLPPELANLFLATGPTNWQLGDSAEQGAEAW